MRSPYEWRNQHRTDSPRCPKCGLAVLGLKDHQHAGTRTIRRRCLGCKKRWTVDVTVSIWGGFSRSQVWYTYEWH